MAYATLQELKAYLGISSASDDALLTSLIEASQRVIDDATGRTFEAAVGTRESWQAVGDALFLRHDLLSVTSVTDGHGDPVAVADVRPVDGVWPTRVLKLSAGRWVTPATIAGLWGYSNVAPVSIRQACIRLASWMYRQKDAQVLDVAGQYDIGRLTITSRLPRDVEQMIAPYMTVGVML